MSAEYLDKVGTVPEEELITSVLGEAVGDKTFEEADCAGVDCTDTSYSARCA